MTELKAFKQLQVFLSTIFAILLALIYYIIPQPTDKKLLILLLNTIPSLIAVLIGIPAIYFLFSVVGLEKLYNKRNSKLNKIETILSELSENFNTRMAQLELVRSFEEEFYECDWKELINSASCHIEIVVYYFDSWVNRYRKELINFLSRAGTKITVIVCDPDIEENLENIARLYPDSDKQMLKSKIIKTYTCFSSLTKDAGVSEDRIEFFFYPHLLNYSIQRFDSSKTVISLFEMFRQSYLKSPVFVLDTDKSPKLRSFFDKEIQGLKEHSRKQ